MMAHAKALEGGHGRAQRELYEDPVLVSLVLVCLASEICATVARLITCIELFSQSQLAFQIVSTDFSEEKSSGEFIAPVDTNKDVRRVSEFIFEIFGEICIKNTANE